MSYTNQPDAGYPASNHFYQTPPPLYQPPSPPPPPASTIVLCSVFSAICTIIIITCAVILMIWLAVRPHLPHFSVNSFSISTPFNLTQNHLTTSWDVGFTISNPNKKSNLHFNDMQGGVIYEGDWLGYLKFPPFVQGAKSEILKNASFVASYTFLETADVNVMNEDRRRNNGTLGFNILVLADVRFKVGIWRVRRKTLKVYCEGLVIPVDGNGTMSNGFRGPKPCIVG